MPIIGEPDEPVKPTKEEMMHANTNHASVLEDIKAPVRVKLAALWATLMFVYVYVDILSFYKPGVIEDILAGTVWKLEITQAWAFGALGLMTIPILMVFLSLVLPAQANRMTNIIVASLYVVVSVGNAVGEHWAYWFAFAALVEVVVLALVIWYSCTWPRTEPQLSSDSLLPAYAALGLRQTL